jgi:inosine-uridine nucleoside N-ribohydrolase
MGGAVYRGYSAGSRPEPEWNIKSNSQAARKVFTSGVPLLVAPLDSTADLKLTPDMRVRILGRGTPLTDALGALDQIWRYTNHWKGDVPTLFDVLAVELAVAEPRYELRDLRIEVTDQGLTLPVEGAPNAKVAVTVDIARFMDDFVARLAR